MIELLPTNTCPPDLSELSRLSNGFSFARAVQLDVSDGLFTPALSWPFRDGQWEDLQRMAASGEKLPAPDGLLYETHMMVEDPLRLGEALARVGCARVLGHLESFAEEDDIRLAFDRWKQAGAKEVGLALLFDTPISSLQRVADICDAVQLMSIKKLGFQGAAFEPEITARIRELHEAHPQLVIAIDGGVSEKNIAELVRAGASRFGVGSAISKAPDPKAAYEQLLSMAEAALTTRE